MPSDTTKTQYDKVAVSLHWLAAAVVLTMLASGLTMEFIELEKKLKFQLYQWHKSLGVLFLFLIAIRLLWRFTHKPPALPASIHGAEAKAAHVGHFLLYAAMIVMPLSGWVIVSSSVYGLPTMVFDWFQWPHIPNLTGNEIAHEMSETTHAWVAYSLLALIALHIAGTIKHSLIDKTPILYRMQWKRR